MKKFNRIVINGNELIHEMDGMTRVAFEVVRRLDHLLLPGQAQMVVKDRNDLRSLPRFQNIRIVERKGPFVKWEFVNLDLYSMLTDSLELRFRNRAGHAKGIFYLHDVIPLSFYGEKSVCGRKDMTEAAGKAYHRNIKRMKRNALAIVTVSDFSKAEIMRCLDVDGNRVAVIKNGWEHFRDIRPDMHIFERFRGLKEKQYFFSLGSISPHKNFGFIYEMAKRNKAFTFVIAGRMNRGLQADVSDADNLVFTGGLTDGQIKALMMNCKAFLFPSFIEGMGLPVLEALSCGAEVCVSDIPVMHEYAGGSVHYFDPEDAGLDIESLINERVSKAETALENFSWNKAAEDLYALIMKYLKAI